jgi:hypothetical protein
MGKYLSAIALALFAMVSASPSTFKERFQRQREELTFSIPRIQQQKCEVCRMIMVEVNSRLLSERWVNATAILLGDDTKWVAT